MNEMTETENSSPGGLSPSPPPLGHGGSPQYGIFTSELGIKGQSGGRTCDLRLSKQAALTTG